MISVEPQMLAEEAEAENAKIPASAVQQHFEVTRVRNKYLQNMSNLSLQTATSDQYQFLDQ